MYLLTSHLLRSLSNGVQVAALVLDMLSFHWKENIFNWPKQLSFYLG